MKPVVSAGVWLAVYVSLVLAPLLVLKFGNVPPGSGFWWDFSMALGFAGLAMMGIQFILTARFKRLTAPYGIDIIYFFHRYLAVIAFVIILAHLGIIYLTAAAALSPRNPFAAPIYMTAGRLAIVMFAVIIFVSLFRRRLGLEYDRWRFLHVLLATSAFVLSAAHVAGVGYYIEAPGKKIFWIAYSLFWVSLVVYVRVFKPWYIKQRPYQVTEVRQERGHVHTLILKPAHPPAMQFAAGQFAWLSLDSPYRLKEHPFSMSSIPDTSGQLAFTIKELGDFTRRIKSIKPGTVMYVDGPYGSFTLNRFTQAPALVFIAGGVGIAPIMSMLRSLASHRDPRPSLLFYGNEDWQRVTFREELEQITQEINLDIVHVLKQPPAGWTGETGLITRELLQRRLQGHWLQAEYFICGPGVMRVSVERSLDQLGISLWHVHSEIFELV